MQIEEIVRELCSQLGLPGTQHEEQELSKAYENGLPALIQSIQCHARVPCRFILDYGIAGPAASIDLRNIPLYGTNAFRTAAFRMCVRQTFVQQAPLATLAYAIAHELAHILLHATRSRFRFSEEATDLCAMALGYDHITLAGQQYTAARTNTVRSPWWHWPFLERSRTELVYYECRVGYLTPVQCLRAAAVIGSLR